MNLSIWVPALEIFLAVQGVFLLALVFWCRQLAGHLKAHDGHLEAHDQVIEAQTQALERAWENLDARLREIEAKRLTTTKTRVVAMKPDNAHREGPLG